jgi:hypothetical protein
LTAETTTRVTLLTRVVVELLDRRDHDARQQGAAIGVEESIQGAANDVITHVGRLVGIEPERLRGKSGDDFLLPVDGLPLHQNRT